MNMTVKHWLHHLERTGTVRYVEAWREEWEPPAGFLILWGGVQWGGAWDASGAGDATFDSVAAARRAVLDELGARREAGL